MKRRRAFDVLAIGEILIDFIAPDAESLASAERFIAAPGGAPANVAMAVRRLGGSAAFAGAIGSDPFGIALRNLLSEQGVETGGLRTVASPTTLAFVARNDGGIPDFLFHRGADAEMQPEDIPAGHVANSTFLYLSSMGLLAEPSRSATLYARELAKEAGTLVAVDPNLRPSSWPSLDAAREAILPLIRGADILKVNEEEARILADTADPGEAVERLGAEASLLVVTLGAQGCRWRVAGAEGSVRAPEVEVVDSTGAGDAFMGALLAELSRQGFTSAQLAPLDIAALEQALRFACAAGARACTRTGVIPALPSLEDVRRALESPRTP